MRSSKTVCVCAVLCGHLHRAHAALAAAQTVADSASPASVSAGREIFHGAGDLSGLPWSESRRRPGMAPTLKRTRGRTRKAAGTTRF